MEDDSRSSIVKSLKNEWSLFWETISGENESPEESKDTAQSAHLKVLSLDGIKDLTRELSENRKVLHQRLESLQKEIDLNAAKLESLRLVGASDKETLKRMNELHDQGQKLSQELDELNQRLRLAREYEDRLRRELTPA